MKRIIHANADALITVPPSAPAIERIEETRTGRQLHLDEPSSNAAPITPAYIVLQTGTIVGYDVGARSLEI